MTHRSLGWCALVLWTAFAGPAYADAPAPEAPREEPAAIEPAGTVSLALLLAGENLASSADIGGALTIEAGVKWKLLRLGGVIGGAAVSSEQDDHSLAILPLGLSVGAEFDRGKWSVMPRLRGGFWAGATNNGLTAGGWLSLGLHSLMRIGPEAEVTLGIDLWWIASTFNTWAWAPSLGFAW